MLFSHLQSLVKFMPLPLFLIITPPSSFLALIESIYSHMDHHFTLLDMHDLEESAMNSFEDIDLGSPARSPTTDKATNDQRTTTSLANDLNLRDSENRPLRARRVRVPSEEAYKQAFLPFHIDRGTSYSCIQSHLDVHNTGAFQKPNHRPFVSPMDATREIMRHNHITRRVPPVELDAIHNLRSIVYMVEKRMDFGPDLAIKAFADLDLVFFGGQLRNHVRVQWVRASDHPRFAVPRGLWGATIHLPERGKCVIRLNADLLLRQHHGDDPLGLIFGTLLHEMCHAYQIVRCGYGRVGKRRGHDEFFCTRIAVIHQRAVRVLGLWAIGRDEFYRQYHFFPGEQMKMGVVVEWVVDVMMDVDDRVAVSLDKAAEMAVWGLGTVKRWVLADKRLEK